jgi:hypothetical protein
VKPAASNLGRVAKAFLKPFTRFTIELCQDGSTNPPGELEQFDAFFILVFAVVGRQPCQYGF